MVQAQVAAEAFPFPRRGDIDGMNPEQIRDSGYSPPFHGLCRCDVTMLWRRTLPEGEHYEMIEPRMLGADNTSWQNFGTGQRATAYMREVQRIGKTTFADHKNPEAVKFLNRAAQEIDDIQRSSEAIQAMPGVEELRFYKKRIPNQDEFTAGLYNHDTHVLSLKVGDKFDDAVRLRLGEGWSVDETMWGNLRHEYGHHVWNGMVNTDIVPSSFIDEWVGKIYWNRGTARWASEVSQYAAGESGEAFAECFSAYTSKQYVRGSLPKDIEDYFDRLFSVKVKK